MRTVDFLDWMDKNNLQILLYDEENQVFVVGTADDEVVGTGFCKDENEIVVLLIEDYKDELMVEDWVEWN